MDSYFDASPMEQSAAVDLFQAHTLIDLRDRMVWVRAFFERQHQLHDYLGMLVRDLYRKGYRLYSGDLGIQSLGHDLSQAKVYLWARQEDLVYGHSHSDLRLSLDDTVVAHEDKTPLITQAVAIRKAYQNGFDARSKEVRTALSGLMGVDIESLTDAR